MGEVEQSSDLAVAARIVTRDASRRIVEAAFRHAAAHDHPRQCDGEGADDAELDVKRIHTAAVRGCRLVFDRGTTWRSIP